MKRTVGVLALQGAYQKHADMLHQLGIATVFVRKPDELQPCSALIIPGGESTTISLLVQQNGLYQPIRDFAEKYPVMGVCAGMIMMATDVDDDRVTPLGLIPFTAKRNYYGRQVHSFQAEVDLGFYSEGSPFPAIFIRAPGVDNITGEVNVLAEKEGEALILSKGRHMALSFHPELTSDPRIHDYWLNHLNAA